jgi:hypothetical protein
MYGNSQAAIEWIEASIDLLSAEFSSYLSEVKGDRIRANVGFPDAGGRSANSQRLCQVWPSDLAGDGRVQLFLNPMLGEETETSTILGAILHSLLQVQTGVEKGFKAPFPTLAKSIGFKKMEGRGFSNPVSPTGGLLVLPPLRDALDALSERVPGAYPHPRLNAELRKAPQTTRLVLGYCECKAEKNGKTVPAVKVRFSREGWAAYLKRFPGSCSECGQGLRPRDASGTVLNLDQLDGEVKRSKAKAEAA